MSKRRIFNLLFVGFLLLSTETKVAGAQMPMDPPPVQAEQDTPEQNLKRLTKTLKLSEQQRLQILPILRERSDSMSRLFADREVPMEDRFPKTLEIIDRSNARIRGVLLEAQQKRLEKIIAEEKMRWESGPDDGMPPGGMLPPPQ